MFTIYFTPQPDISAYELAIIVGHLGGVPGMTSSPPPMFGIAITEAAWSEMGSLQRHWSTTKPEKELTCPGPGSLYGFPGAHLGVDGKFY